MVNNKVKILILSFMLIALTGFVKINTKDEKVINIPINSAYANRLRVAKKIMDEKRDYVYIDKNIKLNPVVYELKLISESYDSQKTNQYFIKQYLKNEYINKLCKDLDVVITNEEFEEYKNLHYSNLHACKRDRIALINGYSSFIDYSSSDDFKKEFLSKLRYERLIEINASKNNIDNEQTPPTSDIFDENIDKEVEKIYNKYKNKNRY